jgi:hypothetical protein
MAITDKVNTVKITKPEDKINKYDGIVYTSKFLAAGDQIEINYDWITGKVVIKDIDERDKKILRLGSDIEAYQSQIKWLLDYLNTFVTEEENDTMDHIALLRAKRIEIEQFRDEHPVYKTFGA